MFQTNSEVSTSHYKREDKFKVSVPTLTKYSKPINFRQGKIFTNFTTCLLSMANVEGVVIFTALAKIHSTKCDKCCTW